MEWHGWVRDLVDLTESGDDARACVDQGRQEHRPRLHVWMDGAREQCLDRCAMQAILPETASGREASNAMPSAAQRSQ